MIKQCNYQNVINVVVENQDLLKNKKEFNYFVV